MIICNGCSKTGTHFLTNIMNAAGFKQAPGTLICRKREAFETTSKVLSVANALHLDDSHFIHSHVIHSPVTAKALAPHRHFLMIRHPRNVAVSWLRHRTKNSPRHTPSPDLLCGLIKNGMFGLSIPQFYYRFIAWREEAGVKCLRFENLAAREPETVGAVFEHAGASFDAAAVEAAFGKGPTFNAKFSDWRDETNWTGSVETAWVASGGDWLESALGYSNR